MATTRGRIVKNNEVVYDQADYFLGDGYSRVTGLSIATTQMAVFYKNIVQPWLFADGTNVSEAQVSSGTVYFNEIPGSSGYYSVRFRPNAVGYWRLIIVYPTGLQIEGQDYDVNDTGVPSTGLSSTFIKPGPPGSGC